VKEPAKSAALMFPNPLAALAMMKALAHHEPVEA
jgi:hypothetical protein